MAINTLVNVAVFGLVPIPPMPDTSSTWSRPSKMVAKLQKEIERHGLEELIRSARRLLIARGSSRDWMRTKTAWRVANRDRWKAFQQRR